MTRSTFSSSVKHGYTFYTSNIRSTLSILCQKGSVWLSVEGRQSCGWGCLSVTWPDDSLQQRHPASQKLKVCLQVVEHLQANVLLESIDRGGLCEGGWKHQPESWGCSRLFPLPVPGVRCGGWAWAPHLWPLPKADPASGLLLTMNTDHSLKD